MHSSDPFKYGRQTGVPAWLANSQSQDVLQGRADFIPARKGITMHRVSFQSLTRIQSPIYNPLWLILVLALLLFALSNQALLLQAQTVRVGAGSYTTTLPAGAAAPSSQVFS